MCALHVLLNKLSISNSVKNDRNYSLLWPKSVPLCQYQTFFFSAHQLMDAQVAFTSCLMAAVLQLTWECTCLFGVLIIFPWCRHTAITGIGPSYASYIFNSSGTSTLFPQWLNKYLFLPTLYSGSLFCTTSVDL